MILTAMLCWHSLVFGTVRWAEPGYPTPGVSDLLSCIDSSAAGDTIMLRPGWHVGPISISKNMTIMCSSAGEASIVGWTRPVSISNCQAKFRNVVIESSKHDAPDQVVIINNATAQFDTVGFRSGTLGGSTLVVKNGSIVQLTACDLQNCPRHYIVELVNCPNNVTTTSCLWPTNDPTLRGRLIYDKIDNPALGLVTN
jgi:hypothetical protein